MGAADGPLIFGFKRLRTPVLHFFLLAVHDFLTGLSFAGVILKYLIDMAYGSP